MSRLGKVLLIIQLLFFSMSTLAVEVTFLKPPRQRVIFDTDFGNLVFSLYSDTAPKHVAQITKLVESGAYDSTHFFRVTPGFVLQLSDIYDRKIPLTAAQKAANQRLPAEFSSTMKHRAGSLSMARETDDKDSASSSFSILLDQAPHLDGQYTIFGELESGASVIRKMLAIPRHGETPDIRLSVNSAYLLSDSIAYYQQHPFDPVNSYGQMAAAEKILVPLNPNDAERTRLIAIMMTAIILVSLTGFFLYERISKPRLLSLLLLNVLIAVFLLFILLTPEGHKTSWLAALVFIGLFSMFRLLSNFESKRD